MMIFGLALSGAIISGLITSISPCPMTTNLAAISYIGRQTGNTRNLLISGLLYALGRAFAYTAAAFCIVSLTLFSGDYITRVFAAEIHFWIGPPLIILGMFFCGLLSFNFGGNTGEWGRTLFDKWGTLSAFPVGILFAMAFCPTSAAAFIAMLGLATQAKSALLIPMAFGLATSAPVLVFTIILAFAPHLTSRSFAAMTKIDFWTREIAGFFLIALGAYYSVEYVWLPFIG